jgi:hypothetical protein
LLLFGFAVRLQQLRIPEIQFSKTTQQSQESRGLLLLLLLLLLSRSSSIVARF